MIIVRLCVSYLITYIECVHENLFCGIKLSFEMMSNKQKKSFYQTKALSHPVEINENFSVELNS